MPQKTHPVKRRQSILKQSSKQLHDDNRHGFRCLPPRVLLDLGDETCQRAANFWHVVEVIGMWPVTTRCTTFFVLPKIVCSDRPIALLATQI